MHTTKRFAALAVECRALQVRLATGASETSRMIVPIQCFDPLVARFNRVRACVTLGREQYVPIALAVRHIVFEVKRRITEGSTTMAAHEARWVPLLVESVETVAFDADVALGAHRRKVCLIAALAVVLMRRVLYETNVQE